MAILSGSELWLRGVYSALTAFAMVLCLGRPMIRLLQRQQMGQVVRDDGPGSHLSKAGTPTMGGLLMVFAVCVSAFVWGDWHQSVMWCFAVTLLGFAGIGFWDDYCKCVRKDYHGLSARYKFLWQSLFALVIGVYFYHLAPGAHSMLHVPFDKAYGVPLGMFAVFLTYVVIAGTSNAVNLTDGLDGLATVPIALVAAAMAALAYVAADPSLAHHFSIPMVQDGAEVMVWASAVAGVGFGFLFFNKHPAQVFMGDVGSLSLGALLGVIAVWLRQELLLLLMGGVFVAETVSVMLQVASFRLRGKRVFRMAPLHHHYELLGWSESKVVRRFWWVTVLLVGLGLLTLCLR